MTLSNIHAAEVLLPTRDLGADLTFFTEALGFRLETIFPADDPAVATMSGHGLKIRIDRAASHAPGVLRLLCTEPAAVAGGVLTLTAPGGVRVDLVEAHPAMVVPATNHAFMVRRLVDGPPWVIGRAGMQYRDLIPGRLGGSIIASHIRIPDAGPVPDMVHYHTVGFQLIYCYTGWVRLVYEDQGPPFILAADDCVIQPPQNPAPRARGLGQPAGHRGGRARGARDDRGSRDDAADRGAEPGARFRRADVLPQRSVGCDLDAMAGPRLRGARDRHRRRYPRRGLGAGGAAVGRDASIGDEPRLRHPVHASCSPGRSRCAATARVRMRSARATPS